MTQTIEIRLTRQDKAAGHYYYVPFEVPAGTTRIDLKFTARRDDECQLDGT